MVIGSKFILSLVKPAGSVGRVVNVPRVQSKRVSKLGKGDGKAASCVPPQYNSNKLSFNGGKAVRVLFKMCNLTRPVGNTG